MKWQSDKCFAVENGLTFGERSGRWHAASVRCALLSALRDERVSIFCNKSSCLAARYAIATVVHTSINNNNANRRVSEATAKGNMVPFPADCSTVVRERRRDASKSEYRCS